MIMSKPSDFPIEKFDPNENYGDTHDWHEIHEKRGPWIQRQIMPTDVGGGVPEMTSPEWYNFETGEIYKEPISESSGGCLGILAGLSLGLGTYISSGAAEEHLRYLSNLL